MMRRRSSFGGGRAGWCPVEAAKRVSKRSRTPSLSCANVVEVQVDLGGIQPKTAPCTDGC